MAVEGGYLTELLTEKDNLDPSFVHSMRLLTEGRRCIFSKITSATSRKVGAQKIECNVSIPSRSRTTSCLQKYHILVFRANRSFRIDELLTKYHLCICSHPVKSPRFESLLLGAEWWNEECALFKELCSCFDKISFLPHCILIIKMFLKAFHSWLWLHVAMVREKTSRVEFPFDNAAFASERLRTSPQILWIFSTRLHSRRAVEDLVCNCDCCC